MKTDSSFNSSEEEVSKTKMSRPAQEYKVTQTEILGQARV